jgi:hypothetical protein
MRVLALPALLLALVLAGCAEDSAPTQDAPVCEFGTLDDGQCAPPPAKPEPININREEVMLTGTSRVFSWSILPGVQRYMVSVLVSGPQDVPAYQLVGYRFALLRDGTVVDATGCDGCGFGGVGGSGYDCMLCWSPETDDDGIPLESESVGNWTLQVKSQPSFAQYKVEVRALYDVPKARAP